MPANCGIDDLVSFLVLQTSYYSQNQFKGERKTKNQIEN